jgi:hypothetical protein
MTQLITIQDFINHKPLSVNLNAQKKLDPFILEAQQFDLKKLMGDAFYLEFMRDFESSPSLQVYDDLFNGSEFQYSNETCRHEGLKSVLIYLSYARYVLNSNVESTAFGTVRKITEESQMVDDKTIIRLHDQAYNGAMAYWEDVKFFLNQQNYRLWLNCTSVKRVSSMRVGSVGAVSERNYNKRKTRP